MKSLLLRAAICLVAAMPESTILAAAGQPFTIEVSVRAGAQQQQTQHGCSSSAPGRRPVLTTKARTKLHVRWSVLYPEKTGRFADVTVHTFVEREAVPGQNTAPKPGPDVVYESALVMDFGPQGQSTGDFVIDVPDAGSYVLRVETMGDGKTPREECFAAMDLKVIP
jgi:hypothetical protein